MAPRRGIKLYMLAYIFITCCLVRVSRLSSRGNHHSLGRLRFLAFLGNKYETEFFYWEAVIVRADPLELCAVAINLNGTWQIHGPHTYFLAPARNLR